ncbi:MAG: thioesterase [Calditrichia bacterium]
MTHQPQHTFKMEFVVRTYEVNQFGLATFQTIANYLQEAASIHAEGLGFGYSNMVSRGIAWVLVRLSVQMDAYPGWKEKVTVKTWPSFIDTVYAYRDFTIYNSQNHAIGKATSQWAIINLESKKIVRPSSINIELPEHTGREFLPKYERIPSLSEPQHQLQFNVRKSDLDLNRHVNNVKYIEWALEAIPETSTGKMVPGYFDIVFRNETFYGDQIISEVFVQDKLVFYHSVKKANTEVARAISEWKIF